MRAFEEPFLFSKIKRRPIRECTDRDNCFEVGKKRYIYATDEEFDYLNSVKDKNILSKLSNDDIFDIFFSIYMILSYNNTEVYSHSEYICTTFDYKEIESITIINKDNFILEIRSYAITGAYYSDYVYSDYGYFNIHYKRSYKITNYGFNLDYINDGDIKNIQENLKENIKNNLDDDFIEICENGDVDDAYLVYSMDEIGSKIMPFNYFNELYELVKS